MRLETRLLQQLLDIAEGAAVFRRDRGAADEVAGDGEGVGRGQGGSFERLEADSYLAGGNFAMDRIAPLARARRPG